MEAVIRMPSEVLGPLNEVELKNAPQELFLAGDLRLLGVGPRVSVVGSRAASPEGLKRARSLARALVRHNMVVVSGLASGIDTAAHVAAIEAGGRTIAVIATPLDQSYPKQNAELQARIAREHLLVSQFAPGSGTRPGNFVRRNLTVALISHAVVVVEAGERSGSRHVVAEALRLGRAVLLLESVARQGAIPWVAEALGRGARVLTRGTLAPELARLRAVVR